ncbi:start domain protein [Anaeramoeba ignava]|uniref:Start domain protein n=1 Tax=Anaeramoeba ignava TaxID=1746090 RepID=A0A9Q0LRK6_ANAIG|nr:start domain protein [Anaeramoeba ignava]
MTEIKFNCPYNLIEEHSKAYPKAKIYGEKEAELTTKFEKLVSEGFTEMIKEIEGEESKGYEKEQGKIRATPKEVLMIILDVGKRLEWDKGGEITQGQLIGFASPHMAIGYTRFKTSIVTSDRDFVTVRGYTVLEDGTIYSPCRSIEVEECPVVKKVVRGVVIKSDWIIKPVDNGKASDVIFISHTDPKGSLPKGKIRATPKEVLMILVDVEKRLQWDKGSEFTQGTIAAFPSPHMAIGYVRFKTSFITSDRDFVVVRGYTVLEDGTIYSSCRNVEVEECPIVKKVVRGFLFKSDWVIKPVDNGKASEVIFISHADPKGSLPKGLANRATLGQLEAINKLDDWFEKKAKESDNTEWADLK